MRKYVVGFLFDRKGWVALIEKKRPRWQKGRFNGIGGHIEKEETPWKAMRREFYEEAGALLDGWHQYCVFGGKDWKVYCFVIHVRRNILLDLNKTDERVSWFSPGCLPDRMIPNLRWLIPMAEFTIKTRQHIDAQVKYEKETC